MITPSAAVEDIYEQLVPREWRNILVYIVMRRQDGNGSDWLLLNEARDAGRSCREMEQSILGGLAVKRGR